MRDREREFKQQDSDIFRPIYKALYIFQNPNNNMLRELNPRIQTEDPHPPSKRKDSHTITK